MKSKRINSYFVNLLITCFLLLNSDDLRCLSIIVNYFSPVNFLVLNCSPARRGEGSTRSERSSQQCPTGSWLPPRRRCRRTWWWCWWRWPQWWTRPTRNWSHCQIKIKTMTSFFDALLLLLASLVEGGHYFCTFIFCITCYWVPHQNLQMLTRGPRRSPWPGRRNPDVQQRAERSQLGPGCVRKFVNKSCYVTFKAVTTGSRLWWNYFSILTYQRFVSHHKESKKWVSYYASWRQPRFDPHRTQSRYPSIR